MKAGLRNGDRAGARIAGGLRRTPFRSSDGRSISLLFVLPLALPGIVTGIALNSFVHFSRVNLSMWTIVIGHATFCIVVVYNNALARLRRVWLAGRGVMDLGAKAGRRSGS